MSLSMRSKKKGEKIKKNRREKENKKEKGIFDRRKLLK